MINLKRNFQDVLEFINNKVCLTRLDLNVPFIDGLVSDTTRVEKIIPTLKLLLNRNAKVVIISHRGRPKGKNIQDLSLKPLVKILEKQLGSSILFEENHINNEKTEKRIKNLKPGNILLLENIRFYSQEETNDPNFSKKIARLGDIYINDSFSTSHRNHSSISGVASFLPSFPGKLFEHELENLNIITKNLEETYSLAILGGSKISTKIDVIENLLKKFKKILIGGAMANTFLAAKGINIGKSFCEIQMKKNAGEILKIGGSKILLPEDVVVANSEDGSDAESISISNISDNDYIYDIGPKTRKNFFNEIQKSKKILWNGPLGYFEKKPFDNGTNYIISSIKSLNSHKIFSAAGGGDTIAALKNSGNYDAISFVSTGGGAFLKFIEGKKLPGIEILNK